MYICKSSHQVFPALINKGLQTCQLSPRHASGLLGPPVCMASVNSWSLIFPQVEHKKGVQDFNPPPPPPGELLKYDLGRDVLLRPEK